MYNSQTIVENVKKEIKKQNINTKEMLESIGLGKNTMSNLKSSIPKVDTLAKIADYLNVSIDYLLGREEYIVQNNISSRDNNTNIIGNNNTVNVQLTTDEQQLLHLYRDLTDIVKKAKVITFIAETK